MQVVAVQGSHPLGGESREDPETEVRPSDQERVEAFGYGWGSPSGRMSEGGGEEGRDESHLSPKETSTSPKSHSAHPFAPICFTASFLWGTTTWR